MPVYKSFFVTLHHIDFNSKTDEINEITNIQQEEDLAHYINIVISDILEGKNIRSFEKNSDNTEPLYGLNSTCVTRCPFFFTNIIKINF